MDDFLTYLGGEVNSNSENWKVNVGQGFSIWYAQEAFDLEQEEAIDAVRIDGSNDKDIDLFWLDDKNEKVIIAQLKFNKNGNYTPKKGELLSLVHSIDWLNDPSALESEGREELISAASDYKNGIENGYGVEFQYVFLGRTTKEVKDQAELLNSKFQSESPSKQVRVIDIEMIEYIHNENIGQSNRVSSDYIEIAKDLSFKQRGKFGTALVATVKGSELVRLFNEHGERLFARNIRLFLGMRKGGVNAGINETINDDSERDHFWAYNNGATIICDQFRKVRDQNVYKLYNFSIVNGCQTAVSLVESSIGSEGKEVHILVRIIAAPEKIIDNIIFFTNSQNPIRRWELKTQDKIQKRLREQLAEGDNPYYYALRRGEEKTLDRKERGKFVIDGKFRQMKYDQVAQYFASFKGLPYVAYKDKGKIFGSSYDSVFPVDTRVEEIVLAWRCAEIAATVVREKIDDANSREEEIDALIFRRGGVIFLISVMSILLHLRNGGNFLSKLKREVVGSKKTGDRLLNYAKVGAVLYNNFMRRMAGTDGAAGIAPILRTQNSYADLKRFVESEWEMRSIDSSWVNSLPKLVR